MPLAVYALMAGAFGIGVTEFVIMGLLLEISVDLGVSVQAAGLLISGYALVQYQPTSCSSGGSCSQP